MSWITGIDIRRKTALLLHNHVTSTAGKLTCLTPELLLRPGAIEAAQRLAGSYGTRSVRFAVGMPQKKPEPGALPRSAVDWRGDEREKWMTRYADPLRGELEKLLLANRIRNAVTVDDDGDVTIYPTPEGEER